MTSRFVVVHIRQFMRAQNSTFKRSTVVSIEKKELSSSWTSHTDRDDVTKDLETYSRLDEKGIVSVALITETAREVATQS